MLFTRRFKHLPVVNEERKEPYQWVNRMHGIVLLNLKVLPNQRKQLFAEKFQRIIYSSVRFYAHDYYPGLFVNTHWTEV